MSLDTDIQKNLREYAKRMQSLLKEQAPVRTGDLQRSIQVTVEKTQKGFAITRSFLFYGVFTNLGTGDYYTIKYGTRQANPFFLPSWDPNPGKGSYGIKPRYWESVRALAPATGRLKQELLLAVKKEAKNKLKAALKKKR